jgi:hypothetical protein
MFGQNFIGILAKDDICTEGISFTDNVPTSVASILVDNDGTWFFSILNAIFEYLTHLF